MRLMQDHTFMQSLALLNLGPHHYAADHILSGHFVCDGRPLPWDLKDLTFNVTDLIETAGKPSCYLTVYMGNVNSPILNILSTFNMFCIANYKKLMLAPYFHLHCYQYIVEPMHQGKLYLAFHFTIIRL